MARLPHAGVTQSRTQSRNGIAAACDFGSKFTHICITDPNRNMVLCHRIDMSGATIERINRLITFIVGNRFLPPSANRESIRVLVEKQTPKNPVCFALMYATIACIEMTRPHARERAYANADAVRVIDPKLKFAKLGIVADFKNKSHKLQMTKFVKNYLIEHNVKIQLFGHSTRASAHTRMRTATNVESKIVEPCQLYTDDFIKTVKFDDIADCIGMILAHADDMI